MVKLISGLAVFCVVLAAACPAMAAESPPVSDILNFDLDVPSTDPGSVGAAVATGNANVREGPGTNYGKLGKLKKGQTVAVWAIHGKWAEITWTGSQRGYVYIDYLRFETEPSDASPGVPSTDPGSVGAAVATGNANVREGPGTNYGKLGKLKKGQTVAVWAIHGKWAEITWTGSQRGYVYIDYLRFETEPSDASPGVPSTDPGSVGAAVATGNANVREGPGTNYGKLGKLKKGQTVAVWAIHGKWAEITWAGSRRGYVYIDYLKFE